jgi:hypothetical protein
MPHRIACMHACVHAHVPWHPTVMVRFVARCSFGLACHETKMLEKHQNKPRLECEPTYHT